MEHYTVPQVNRALVQERLLQRLGQGEPFDTLCQELGLSLSRRYLPELRQRYRQGGSSWMALIDHRHGHASKVTPERRAWLYQQKRQTPALTQGELARRFQAHFRVALSQSQVSNLLRAEGIALPGGQRYRSERETSLPVERAGVFSPPGRCATDGSAEDGDPGGAGAESCLPGA